MPVGDFYGFYLVQASASPEKVGDGFEAQTIKPERPCARRPMGSVLLGVSQSSRQSFPLSRVGGGFAPEPPKRLPPVAVHPNWTPWPRRSSAR